MSHSQFHSTNLFILRHAWPNLWDKHMTTGRINQVTTFQITRFRRYGQQVGTGNNKVAFPTGSSSTELCSVLDLDRESAFSRWRTSFFNVYRASLSPGLARFGYHFSQSVPKTGIALLFEDYQRPESPWKDAHSRGGSPSGYLKTGLAISK